MIEIIYSGLVYISLKKITSYSFRCKRFLLKYNFVAEKSNNILVLRKSVLNNIHIICGSGSKEEKTLWNYVQVVPYIFFWTIAIWWQIAQIKRKLKNFLRLANQICTEDYFVIVIICLSYNAKWFMLNILSDFSIHFMKNEWSIFLKLRK